MSRAAVTLAESTDAEVSLPCVGMTLARAVHEPFQLYTASWSFTHSARSTYGLPVEVLTGEHAQTPNLPPWRCRDYVVCFSGNFVRLAGVFFSNH